MAPRAKSKAKKPAKKKAAKPSRATKPPKAAPVSVVKEEAALEGPKPLSPFDMQFCHIFVSTNKQVEAWRQLRPDDKDPHKAAHRMIQRPEIREHIKEIYREISKQRKMAANVSARANLLSLELADERLVEVLQGRRRTLGEVMSRDAKSLVIEGAENLGFGSYKLSDELKQEFKGSAPVEDADLLKAVKLAYDRKQGIIKADKAPTSTHTTVMLYKPKWFGSQRQAPTLEGASA